MLNGLVHEHIAPVNTVAWHQSSCMLTHWLKKKADFILLEQL